MKELRWKFRHDKGHVEMNETRQLVLPLYTLSFISYDPVPKSAMTNFQSPSACMSDSAIHCVSV